MLFRLISICLITPCITNAFGQTTSSTRSFSMSGASITIQDEWSVIDNQAGLAFNQNTYAGVNFSNRFMIPELSTTAVIGVVPLSAGSLGASFTYFGGKAYSLDHITIAYGRLLYNWLGAAVQMAYHYSSVVTMEEGESAITGDIGIIAIPSQTFSIGLHIKNPARSGFNSNTEYKLDAGIRFGIQYQSKDLFVLISQAEWDDYEEFNFSIGSQYALVKKFTVRLGFKIPHAVSYSFGFGIDYQRINIDLGFERHAVLGFSSAISLLIRLNKNELSD